MCILNVTFNTLVLNYFPTLGIMSWVLVILYLILYVPKLLSYTSSNVMSINNIMSSTLCTKLLSYTSGNLVSTINITFSTLCNKLLNYNNGDDMSNIEIIFSTLCTKLLFYTSGNVLSTIKIILVLDALNYYHSLVAISRVLVI